MTPALPVPVRLSPIASAAAVALEKTQCHNHPLQSRTLLSPSPPCKTVTLTSYFLLFQPPQQSRGCSPRHHQLAVPRTPIFGSPRGCPPRWGSVGAQGAAAIPPQPAFLAARGIHSQGETGLRGRDSTSCTEELFIAQDGWLQVVYLGGTVAVILFIVCFQNLSKQETTTKKTQPKKKKRKRSKEVGCLPEEPSMIICLIHFLLQISAQEPTQRKCFARLLWRGFGVERARVKAQGVWFSLGSPSRHGDVPGTCPLHCLGSSRRTAKHGKPITDPEEGRRH